MKPTKTPLTAAEFVACLEQLDDSVPLDDAEIEQLLKEANINPQEALKQAMAVVAEAETHARQQRYAQASQQRRAALLKMETPTVKRSRAELLQRIDLLKSTLPKESQPQAYFNSLQAMPDEDLERLVSEFDLLLSNEHEHK